jgi:hypothetical protein
MVGMEQRLHPLHTTTVSTAFHQHDAHSFAAPLQEMQQLEQTVTLHHHHHLIIHACMPCCLHPCLLTVQRLAPPPPL